jgi:hypothetical protein|tara:strand:+ start:10809 stop:11192 length:384 start_codon:yes stop_codon:yes gene_type:complete
MAFTANKPGKLSSATKTLRVTSEWLCGRAIIFYLCAAVAKIIFFHDHAISAPSTYNSNFVITIMLLACFAANDSQNSDNFYHQHPILLCKMQTVLQLSNMASQAEIDCADQISNTQITFRDYVNAYD